VKKSLIKNFGWIDYQQLIELDREQAYYKVIAVMDYLELNVVEDTTREIIHSDAVNIALEGCLIPIPKPNIVMQAVVTLLNDSGISVNVVTASNRISAEIICKEYFGILASKVFGARIDVNDNKRINAKFNEVPYGKNKVDVLKREFNDMPVVTGGDAMWDRYLLN
jgi:phosphoserine phosphatase